MWWWWWRWFGVSWLLLWSSSCDDEICFNGCSGHGTCRDFMCTCAPGWVGDDCSHALARDAFGEILSAGHFNLTSKNFSAAVKKVSVLFVGFSARTCYKCISAEKEYARAAVGLRDLRVPFGRADAESSSTMRERLTDAGATSLPAIVVYRRGFAPRVFDQPHTSEAIVAHAEKLKGPSANKFETRNEIDGFLGGNKTAVLGVFREDEKEELEEFAEVAERYKGTPNYYFGAVVGGEASLELVDDETVDRTPSVVMSVDGRREIAPLDTIDGLADWIDRHSLPLVGELTARNFARYEKLLRPMFLLFLDLRRRSSGGLYNDDLIEELRAVAKDESFARRVTFAYCDGVLYADRMKSLGLFGGAERLPALAFNTNEPGVLAPYPETLPVDRAHLRDFVAAFLSKRVRTRSDVEAYALSKTKKDDGVLPKRKPRKEAPAERVGVSEQFGGDSMGVKARGFADDVVLLATSNFSEALRHDLDAMIMIHATSCERCANLAVYYKKVAQRFREEKVKTLLVARFDASDAAPPIDGWASAELPTILFLPADDKRPPYAFYSGVSKVQPIMRWAQQAASLHFHLPDLCHLSKEDRVLYKQQVTDREKERRRRRRRQEEEEEEEEEL